MAWQERFDGHGTWTIAGEGIREAVPGEGSHYGNGDGLSDFPYEKDVNEKPELILPFADTGYC